MKLISLVLSITLVACNAKPNAHNESEPSIELSKDEKLTSYAFDHGRSLTAYKNIIVINEIGTCINCNNHFSKATAGKLESDSTLFIVSGTGAKVDFSAYIDRTSPNLIFDEFGGFDTLELVSSCAIITLDKGKIQKVENINVKNVSDLAQRKF